MNTQDKEFEELIETVTAYFHALEKPSRNGNRTRLERSRDLVNLCKKVIPQVTRMVNSDDVPAQSYVVDIISSAIRGLSMPEMALLWNEHFLNGRSIRDISNDSGFSPRTLYRRAKQLPDLTAEQLWHVNAEQDWASMTRARTTPPPQMRTLYQKRIGILMDQLGLTTREAQVLLNYCPKGGKSMSQRIIAETLSLSIETIKSHRKSILRKMGVKRIRFAVDSATMLLAANPEANWDKEQISIESGAEFYWQTFSRISARQQQIVSTYLALWPHASRLSVATQLGISVETLKTHIWSICGRFNEPNMRELVSKARHFLDFRNKELPHDS